MDISTPGNHLFKINHTGLERSYFVHVPANYQPRIETPLVIMLHGAGATAEIVIDKTGWCRKADMEKFLVVFPNATSANPEKPPSFRDNPQRWNDGSIEHDLALKKVDDIGFISTAINKISDNYTIDKNRIFVTGFSNGASMTFVLGTRLSNKIAAIAPVAGHCFLETVKLELPVSLLYIVGSDDPFTPLEGGTVKMPWRFAHHKPPVQSMLKKWAVATGCNTEAEVLKDNYGVTAFVYRGCTQNTEVIYYIVDGLGHIWPGGEPELPLKIIGRPSDKLDACEVIWDFFKKHPLHQ